MKNRNQQLIDAVIQKAEKLCPDAIDLIGVYGSAATGDIHEKSDLDLLILINDEKGCQVADCFIVDDIGIGYDLYCTTWEMLEGDAECRHAQLSKLMDAQLVYVKTQSDVIRLEELRKKAADLLASDVRFERAKDAFMNAEKMYAECFLTEQLSKIRTNAGTVIYYLLDALMLYHGRYFKRGVKRTFEETALLNLPFNPEAEVKKVISSRTAEEIRNNLTSLVQNVQEVLRENKEKKEPEPSDLYGTYEEMFSNWRNKMWEAAGREDLFASFMNMGSLQFMLDDIAEGVKIGEIDVMQHFKPDDLSHNAKMFDSCLEAYLKEYEKADMKPNRYADMQTFLRNYLKGTE